MKLIFLFISLLFLYACGEQNESNVETTSEHDSIMTKPMVTDTVIEIIDSVIPAKKRIINSKTIDSKITDIRLEENLENNNPNNNVSIPKPEIQSIFRTKEGKIYFSNKIHDFGNPKVGCSDGNTAYSFEISNPKIGEFEFKDKELSTLNFVYTYSGGLYDAEGKDPIVGKISGKLINEKWEISINLKVPVIDLNIPDKKSVLKNVIYNGTFN